MRRRSLVVVAVPVAALVLAFSAAPALAQPPTTPVPTPTDPSSPPMSAAVGAVPPGRAVGDAGTGLGIVRILPNSVSGKSIVPDPEGKLPRQAAAELGFGLASAQANSEAYLSFEHSVAQAAPGGVAVQGQSPQAPGALAQTASPDNAKPVHGGLSLPSSPLDTLVRVTGLRGQVHARWSDTAGPCVGTISDAATEVASLSLLNAIPTLPATKDLTGVFDAASLDANGDKAVIDGLQKLGGPLSTLGGVLSGGSKPAADGTGSLVSLPNTLSARSVVRLVDIPGSPNKAVQSTSTLQVAALKVLAGTPFEIQIRVVSQPTLQVTSTGDEKTSTVRYTAPVLEVMQGGTSLGRLDAANPKLDIPVGIPLAAGAPNLPIVGDLLADGQKAVPTLNRLDLGVIRLGVAQLDQRGMAMTTPFAGYQLGATARMLDLQVLPTQALGLPNLPSALAQVSLGEQIARAYAPRGGVVCRPSEQPVPPPAPAPQGKAPGGLAYTTAAYKTIPIFWTGTAMLLIGVVLVAAMPAVRTRGFALVSPGGTTPPTDPEPTDNTDTTTEPATEAEAVLDAQPEGDAPPEGDHAESERHAKPEHDAKFEGHADSKEHTQAKQDTQAQEHAHADRQPEADAQAEGHAQADAEDEVDGQTDAEGEKVSAVEDDSPPEIDGEIEEASKPSEDTDR